MSVAFLVLALAAASPLAGAPAAPVSAFLAPPEAAPELAAGSLAAGRAEQAIAALEKASAADPRDAAVLINLGIAYAQTGDEERARDAFRQALACEEVVELETADGVATDSRRLARKALKMLERGEFRTPAATAGQLTYRDR
ncbi:MAG: tetratricopeptide repeat protein [Erythrobacter sp.]|uniref:tetratricopeptide repeat protein n=1 Tax=Erythrobacter sp. TaxID=1042 RepID=UPI0025DF2465|nr:tetratricopeptide repeat protein [Erythrobacter sp.]MCM0000543.1 tetratricopeptide repeat protein [Erythrobacter sp.]